MANFSYKIRLTGYLKHFDDKTIFLSIPDNELIKLKKCMTKVCLKYPYQIFEKNNKNKNTAYINYPKNYDKQNIEKIEEYRMMDVNILCLIRYFEFTNKEGINISGYKLIMESISKLIS